MNTTENLTDKDGNTIIVFDSYTGGKDDVSMNKHLDGKSFLFKGNKNTIDMEYRQFLIKSNE